MVAGVSAEILIVGLVMPIVVALITAMGAVQWRKHSPPDSNPHSILGEGDQTVRQHMNFRASEHSAMAQSLVALDGKVQRVIDAAERNREVTQTGLNTVNQTLVRIEATMTRIEGKLPS